MGGSKFGVGKRKKHALDAATRAAARPATALIVDDLVSDRHPPSSTDTYFGGDPYSETGGEWPVWEPERIPFDFVCQINLSQCPVLTLSKIQPHVTLSLICDRSGFKSAWWTQAVDRA